MSKKIDQPEINVEELEQQIQDAQAQVLRAQADYQNLLRRTREEKMKIIQLANANLILAMLEPLDNLQLAAGQLDDNGLNMVVDQFKKTLEQFEVIELDPIGAKFEVESMEAVENLAKEKDDSELKVVEVRRKGYQMNGVVIRHAQVVVG